MKKIELPAGTYYEGVLSYILDREVKKGELIRLYSKSLSSLALVNIKKVCIGSDECKIIQQFTQENLMDGNFVWYLNTMASVTVELPRDVKAGDKLTLESYGKQAGKGVEEAIQLPKFVDEHIFSIGTITGKNDYKPLKCAEEIIIAVVPAKTEALRVYYKADGRVYINYYDKHGNSTAPDCEGAVLYYNNTEQPIEYKGSIDAEEYRIEGIYRGRIKVVDLKGREAWSNAYPKALDGKSNIYFGEIHWHCEFSGDGSRPLETAMHAAKNQLCLDFASPGDHICSPDSYKNAYFSPEKQREICESFEENGRFALCAGAEINGRYGHANVYARNFNLFLKWLKKHEYEMSLCWRRINKYPLREVCLAAQEFPKEVMIVPHHSNMDSGGADPQGRPYWTAMHFPVNDGDSYKAMRLMEMHQTRGSFETEYYQENWHMGKDTGKLGGSVRTALMKGHRVGFTGGTDNHTGMPANGDIHPVGLTGVICDKLTTANIFDALYSRRCYATTGARIVGDFTLNGYNMGSEIKLKAFDKRELKIKINGTAPIECVEVIQNGVTLAELNVNGTCDFIQSWSDDRYQRPLEDVYYYVRARQSDGHCIWLSPIWVDLEEDDRDLMLPDNR